MPTLKRLLGGSPPWTWPVVAVLIVWGLVAAARGGGRPPEPPAGQGGSDLALYRAVTLRVAAGENYYRVLADELPRRGYPTGSVFNWRLPTLTYLNATAPALAWTRPVLIALWFGLIPVWLLALKRSLPGVTPVAVSLLVVGGAAAVPEFARFFHEIWAGVLISASLGLWAIGRKGPALMAGTAGTLIRELAAGYLLVMAALAWREGRRQEALSWTMGLTGCGLIWLWHAAQVVATMPANELTPRWLVAGGWPFALSTAYANVPLMLLPTWLVALVTPLAWAGALRWRDGVGRRLAAVLSAYLAFFMCAGRPDNWYWGFLIAPLWPLAALGWRYR